MKFLCIVFGCPVRGETFTFFAMLLHSKTKGGRTMEKQLERLEGEVASITYYNEESGFCVFDFETGGELTCVVGEFADISEGEGLVLHGSFVRHPTYGMQFKAVACEHSMPSSASAILKYLSSGAIRGVGPVLARRMVERFGSETLNVIESEPDKLTEVRGITPAKAEKIAEEFQRIYGIRSVMLYLSQFSIEPGTAIKIWKRWGMGTPELIAENPYVLCCEEIGLPFQEADRIAMQLELDAESPQRLTAGVEHVLRENLLAGHTCLPRERLASVAAQLLCCENETAGWAITRALEEERLIESEYGGRAYIYQPPYYYAEQYIAGRIRMAKMQGETPDAHIEEELAALEGELSISLAPGQREGIAAALRYPISILTGGPGTGKTTTINAMLTLFERQRLKVALAAPTGRAAKRMSDMTGREAKTIHRLLEVDTTDPQRRRFRHHEQNTLGYDVIILDEVSMVDTLLFESLLRAMRLQCRMVLVGDADQLPSVSAGNVLHDLIRSGSVHTTRLSEIFRQARESRIVMSAHDIVHGRVPELDKKEGDFFFLGRAGDGQSLQTVGELCSTRLPRAYHYSPLWDIQVIAPTRVGALGTAALNQHLQQLLNPQSPQKAQVSFMGTAFREGDKVMQVKNNYDIEFDRDDGSRGAGVFNGDIGVIESIDRGSRTLFIRYEDRVAAYSFDMLEQLELAYAITVHKSQGSEFEAVVLPLMGYRSKMYFRNLLYTAVTRARRLLVIVGSSGAVRYMVQNNLRTVRYTGLCEFIQGDGQMILS